MSPPVRLGVNYLCGRVYSWADLAAGTSGRRISRNINTLWIVRQYGNSKPGTEIKFGHPFKSGTRVGSQAVNSGHRRSLGSCRPGPDSRRRGGPGGPVAGRFRRRPPSTWARPAGDGVERHAAPLAAAAVRTATVHRPTAADGGGPIARLAATGCSVYTVRRTCRRAPVS